MVEGQMTDRMYRLFMILAIIVNTVPRLIDCGTGQFMDGGKYSPIGRYCYYSGQALTFVFILIATHWPKNKLFFEIALWIAISNAADELFFDPTRLGWNEIFFAIFIIIYSAYKFKKYKIEQNSKRTL